MYLLNHYFKKNYFKKENTIIKVITGLSNFDVNCIIKLVKAAEIGGATYVDIAANTRIVSFVKSITSLPICVSSIDPIELYKCSIAGANIIELGNFDSFYKKNIYFSEHQILQLAQETKDLIKDKMICVTIPHHLLLQQQIRLALNLQKLGIHIFQTEGLSTKIIYKNYYKNNNILNSITCAAAALSSTYTLTQYVEVPIISASGIDLLSSTIAIYYGGSIVGISSALKQYHGIFDMSYYISTMVSSISAQANFLNMCKNWKISLLSNIQLSINSFTTYNR